MEGNGKCYIIFSRFSSDFAINYIILKINVLNYFMLCLTKGYRKIVVKDKLIKKKNHYANFDVLFKDKSSVSPS